MVSATKHRAIVDTHRHPSGKKLQTKIVERGLLDPKQEFPQTIESPTKQTLRLTATVHDCIALGARLAVDRHQTIDMAYILGEVWEELGIEINIARLPGKYLFALTDRTDESLESPDPRVAYQS